ADGRGKQVARGGGARHRSVDAVSQALPLRRRRRGMSRYHTPLQVKQATLSVLMPVYNERETVESIVAAVLDAPVAPIRLELIVVDDGSSDGTRDIVQRLHDEGKIHKLHLQPTNRRKGAAIRHALGLSSGDIVIVQDADLEYDP